MFRIAFFTSVVTALLVLPTASAVTRGQRADGLRWEAKARWYENRPAASYYTAASLHALGARWTAEARDYANAKQASGDSGNTVVYVLLGVGAVLIACGGAAAVRIEQARRSVSLPIATAPQS